jgi:integrase
VGVKVKFYRGAWWIFIDHRGRRRAKKIGDKQTALEVARKVRERLMLGDLSLLATGGESFETFATAWLKEREGSLKASAVRFYRVNLKLYVHPVIGNRPIGSIQRADCRKVLAESRAKGLKVTTVQGIQRTLSAVLSQAVEDGILPANPAFRMGKHVRVGDEPRREIHPLTREEAHTFLETVAAHWPESYAFFLCALRTGLRLGELLGLQWGDLDIAGRFLEVRRNVVSGKVTTPKNAKRRRVDMSKHLAETFDRHLVAAKAAKLKAGRKELTPWVFPNRDGGPLDADNIRRRVFQLALTKAKLRHVRIHDLRHTFASLLIQQGESLAYVRDQLGHSSIQVTVDVYGHLVPGSNRAAVDRLDELPTRNPDATEETSAEAEGGAK